MKVAATDLRYVVRSKFWRTLVHEENFGLIWQIVFSYNTYFVIGDSLNKLGEKSQAAITLGNFVNKP